jgi:hypothetical protein
MSHSCFHRPCQVKTLPVTFSPSRPATDLFNVLLDYGERDGWQRFSLVHIPQNIQGAFEQGVVQGLHLQALETNGIASRSLPGQPCYAVLGVELADGSLVPCIPAAFRGTLWRQLGLAGTLCLTGGLLAATPIAWVGGLLAGLGTHFVRTAMSVPRKPFWPPPHKP